MKATTTLTESLNRFGVDAEMLFGRTNINTILESSTFQAFGSLKPPNQNDTSKEWQLASGRKSALEREPHDYLHGGVDGDMGDVSTSPPRPSLLSASLQPRSTLGSLECFGQTERQRPAVARLYL